MIEMMPYENRRKEHALTALGPGQTFEFLSCEVKDPHAMDYFVSQPQLIELIDHETVNDCWW